MEFLSWLFFCLSPFALFCSEDGTGLLLFPTFIAIGLMFNYAGNHAGAGTTIQIEPQKFWEWHYKDCMRSTLEKKDEINDEVMALKDKEARIWATKVCKCHNSLVPSEGTQEQIARANGVITERMIKESREKKDRIQVGKYILMNELKDKYDTIKVGKGAIHYCPKMRIKMDMDKIKTSNDRYITEYWAYDKYKKSIKEIFSSLTVKEKSQVERWVEEYERQLIDMMREYAEGKRRDDNIKMDF